MTITPVGASSPVDFAFDTPPSRWFSRRNVDVALHENGTIKSINAGATDRTLDIAVSALKVVISLSSLKFNPTNKDKADQEAAATAPAGAATCNGDTVEALRRVEVLRRRIEAHRADLLSEAPSLPAKELQERITFLAAELVRIRTDHLSLALEQNIQFDGPIGTLRWGGNPALSKWITGTVGTSDNLFALHWEAASQSPNGPTITAASDLSALASSCRTDCLVLPTPHPVTLTISSNADQGLVNAQGLALASPRLAFAAMPLAQWGEWRTLRLAPRFGEQLTSGASFDAFGRQLTFAATSEARAQAFATAAQTAVTDYSAWRTAEQASEINDLRAETAELQARQLRNQLRYCEAVIAAGGFVCPTAPTAPPAVP
ncbi:hypothetical protein KB221_07425 [Aquidulcibacter paucihalophilus]|nr:hypothetical protein KB221_07425 [Aquidulcibacter paucihalophilus]